MIFKIKHLTNDLSINKIVLILLLLLLFIMFHLEAQAVANRPVHFVAGVIRKHDDNLFRNDSNKESDNITSYRVGLRLDKKLGLQKITAEANIIKNKYSHNDQLDFTGKSYKAAFHWALTRKLTGKIFADRDEKLNNFNDTQNERKNVRTVENQGFLADFNPNGGWHFLAGFSRQTLDNSEVFDQDASFSANAVDFGMQYIFPSGSSTRVMHHIRRGEYDKRTINQANLFDDGYKEYETEAELDWLLTVKSRVLTNISYIKREHDNFSTRDYSGFQGRAMYDWSPTERISVSLDARSRLSTFQTDVDSYRRTNEIALSPKYKLTPKINITGNLELSRRKHLGSGYQASTNGSRIDKYKTAGIGVEWKPTSGSSIQFKLSHYDQNSNVNQFDYNGNMASISGEIVF